MTMPELALRFILSEPAVTTVIPGMRSARHVAANIAASDAGPLPAELRRRAPGPPLGPRADRVVPVTGGRGRAGGRRPRGRHCTEILTEGA